MNRHYLIRLSLVTLVSLGAILPIRGFAQEAPGTSPKQIFFEVQYEHCTHIQPRIDKYENNDGTVVPSILFSDSYLTRQVQEGNRFHAGMLRVRCRRNYFGSPQVSYDAAHHRLNVEVYENCDSGHLQALEEFQYFLEYHKRWDAGPCAYSAPPSWQINETLRNGMLKANDSTWAERFRAGDAR